MIRTPLSTVVGGAFWTPGATVIGGTSKKTFDQLIQSLFANNEQGFFYNPNDLSTMFQDAAGTTPVTALGQPVGLALDKRLGMALGSELAAAASTAAGWIPYLANTVVDDDGAVKITYVNGADGARVNLTSLTVGSMYRVNFTAKVNTGSVSVGVNGSGFPNVAISSTSYVDRTLVFLATATSHVFYMIGAMAAGEIIWIKNTSVRELAGNHGLSL